MELFFSGEPVPVPVSADAAYVTVFFCGTCGIFPFVSGRASMKGGVGTARHERILSCFRGMRDRYHADGRDASEDGASAGTGVGFSSGDSGRSRETSEKKRSGKETGACPGGIGVLLFPVRGNAAKVGGRGVAPPLSFPRAGGGAGNTRRKTALRAFRV